MTKEELTLEVIRRLKSAYPLAECTLDYRPQHCCFTSTRRTRNY